MSKLVEVKLHGGPRHGEYLSISEEMLMQGEITVVSAPPLRELMSEYEENLTASIEPVKSRYTRVGKLHDFEWIGTL